MIKFFKDKLFQRELKREVRMLIVVGIGFSIAFAWRQTTFDAALSITHAIFSIKGEVAASLTASLMITLIGLLLILLTSKYLKDVY
jgi:hypothetical protein